MVNKLTTLLAVLVLVASVDAFAAAHKGPKATRLPVRGGVDEATMITDGPVPPSVTALGPGDSVGFATYDYGSNGTACHNIVRFDDGAVSIGRMAQDDDLANGRGTYYTFSADGVSWSPFTRTESARSGWGNIDQFTAAGGVEVTGSHSGNLFEVDAARGAGVWSESNTMSPLGLTWPRIAAGGDFWGYMIGAINGGGPAADDIAFTRTPDAGGSFDVVDMTGVFASGSSGADSYDVAASGNNVYVALFPNWDLTTGVGGADVQLASSTDNGTTWSVTVVYDAPAEGELPTGETTFNPDGGGALILDNTGAPHVVWSTYLTVGDANSDPEDFNSQDAPFFHWSAATGMTMVGVYADPDTNIQPAVGRNGNYATIMDCGVDDSGELFILYQKMMAETDANGNNYEHVWSTASLDNGASWGAGGVDVTPGSGFDGAWGSLADHVDDYIHFVYNSDDTAGNAVQGNHATNHTAVMYNMVDKTTIPTTTSVKEIGGGLPTTYALHQNYPNPFNPSTRINYSVPKESFVTIKVYDMIGREVATLVNEEQTAGNYEATFNASNLANGTYFYRLNAGEFTSVKKMMLLK